LAVLHGLGRARLADRELNGLARAIGEALGAGVSALLLPDGDHQLRLAGQAGRTPEEVGRLVGSRAITDDATWVFLNVQARSVRVDGGGSQDMVLAPLTAGGAAVGVLIAGDLKPVGQLIDADLRLLTVAGAIIAGRSQWQGGACLCRGERPAGSANRRQPGWRAGRRSTRHDRPGQPGGLDGSGTTG
jgi:hypothetical protein